MGTRCATVVYFSMKQAIFLGVGGSNFSDPLVDDSSEEEEGRAPLIKPEFDDDMSNSCPASNDS